MRNEYYMVIEMKTGGKLSLRFYNTERNMNKVFYSLAVASVGSDIKTCGLFLRHKDPRNVSMVIKDERINYFEVKNANA